MAVHPQNPDARRSYATQYYFISLKNTCRILYGHSEQIEGTGVDPLEPSFNEGEIAIDNIAIDDERHLIVTFFDGKVTDAGYIGGE